MADPSPPASVLPPSFVLMGFNEGGWLGSGWHDLERDGRTGVQYRATQEKAEIRLLVPEGAAAVHVLLSGSPSLLGKPMTGRLEVHREGGAEGSWGAAGGRGNRPTGIPVKLESDTWVVRRLALSPPLAAPVVVRILVDELVVPDRALHNGDARALGFYVSAVWCR